MRILLEQLNGLLSEEPDPIATMANAAAFLFNALPGVSWAGFYLLRGDDLVVGPFCGKPACTRIKPGRGVCGTAFSERKTIVVPDVHEFPGHIACDPDSRSEIVIPLFGKDSVPFGVLDLDSTEYSRFDEMTADFLIKASEIISLRLND
ncbi:MAG: GAF domain-containing protein [Clostridia bacterium]|nr:GAF domain-containing protein [Clostridia bacterium]